MNFASLLGLSPRDRVEMGASIVARPVKSVKKVVVRAARALKRPISDTKLYEALNSEIVLTSPILGGPNEALPEQWLKAETMLPALGYEVVCNAKVFGGRISERGPGWHMHGQLVLDEENRIVEAALGLMDGHSTYPRDLLEERDEGYSWAGQQKLEFLRGSFFLIGNVHCHFGHVLLEGLTRLWAVDQLRPKAKDLRYVIYETEVPDFAYQLLSLIGIDRSKILLMDRPRVLERLIVPDAAMRTHWWLSDLQVKIWDRIALGVPATTTQRRVFLSRKNAQDRPVQNQEEIENYFVSLGFEVIAPEALPIREQIRLAKESRTIAGFVGSQMYLAAFQFQRTKCFVMAPRNFCLKDDVLIAEGTAKDLKIFLGSSIDFTLPKPQRVWRVDLNRLVGSSEDWLRD